jgi:hypothetical protein
MPHTTKNIVSGMPIGLRSMIKEDSQGDWYRQMYNSLHRHKKHNDYNNRLAANYDDGAHGGAIQKKTSIFFFAATDF